MTALLVEDRTRLVALLRSRSAALVHGHHIALVRVGDGQPGSLKLFLLYRSRVEARVDLRIDGGRRKWQPL
jgi:hypothetical protein